jgi:hypothetical protein
MYINWILNYLIVGILFQWFMYWVSTKLDSEYLFNHTERVMLIFIWPIGMVGFITNIIKGFFSKNE